MKTTERILGTLLMVLVVPVAGCGAEEQEDSCQGLEGRFVAVPVLSVNNCMSTPVVLPQMEMNIPEDSDLRECGWHEITENEDTSAVNGCNRRLSHSLRTAEYDYRGFIILDLECDDGKCLAVWELEFTSSP